MSHPDPWSGRPLTHLGLAIPGSEPDLALPSGFTFPGMTEIRETAQYGRALFATRSYEIGEVVVAEKPLLVMPTSESSAASPFLDAVTSFAAAPKHVQDTVLQMYAPALGGLDSLRDIPAEFHAHVRTLRGYSAADLRSFASSQAAVKAFGKASPPSPDVIARIALISIFNAFQWKGKHPSTGKSCTGVAHFPTIAICAHACDNNASYRWSEERGEQLLIAVRPIAAGEMITDNYIGDYDVSAGTDARRMLLAAEKGFWCTCSRCSTGLDTLSGVPCPECVVRIADDSEDTGLLNALPEAITVASNEWTPTAKEDVQVYPDQQLRDSGEPSFWHCQKCKHYFNDAQVLPRQGQLDGRALYLDMQCRVLQFDRALSRGAKVRDESDVLQQQRTISRVYGTEHWMVAIYNRVLVDLLTTYLKPSNGSQVLSTSSASVKKLKEQTHLLVEVWTQLHWFATAYAGSYLPVTRYLGGRMVLVASSLLSSPSRTEKTARVLALRLLKTVVEAPSAEAPVDAGDLTEARKLFDAHGGVSGLEAACAAREEGSAPLTPACAVPACSASGTLRCSRCREANYCSKEHQVADWPRHKRQCTPAPAHGQ